MSHSAAQTVIQAMDKVYAGVSRGVCTMCTTSQWTPLSLRPFNLTHPIEGWVTVPQHCFFKFLLTRFKVCLGSF